MPQKKLYSRCLFCKGLSGNDLQELFLTYALNATGLSLQQNITIPNLAQLILDVVGPTVNITQFLDSILGMLIAAAAAASAVVGITVGAIIVSLWRYFY